MISQGQRTIVDFNDAASIKGGYTPRKGLTQIKVWTGAESSSLGATGFAGAPTVSGTFPTLTITPHANNQAITPYLKMAGNSTDLVSLAAAGAGIDDVKWTILDSSISPKLEYQWTKATNKWQKSINGAAYADLTLFYQDAGCCWLDPRPPFTMTIIADIIQDSKPLTVWFECSYTDPTTGLKQEERVIVPMQMVVNSASTPNFLIFPPDGEQVRNSTPASIRLIAELYKNGNKDIAWGAGTTCEWFVFDPAQLTDVGGGLYWTKLVHTSSVTEITTVDSVTGITTGGNQLKIFDAAIIGTKNYKCKLVENSITYFAVSTVSDMTDPILCGVSSSGGDVLRNALGSSVLTANLSNGVGQLDGAGTTYAYAWQALDQSGNPTVFRSMPYHATTLSAAASAAATTISVAAVGTAANINSLDLGDKLVIDPGTASEEIIDVHASTAISGAGPFVVTLATGLAKAHASGAVVRVVAKKPITTTVASGGNGTSIVSTLTGFKSSATAPALEIVRIGTGDAAVYRKVVTASGANLTLDLPVGSVSGLALVRATELAYGKAITVNADDVAVKNTFSCMVS